MIRLLPNLHLELHFISLPAHPVLMVDGKQTWFAVLNRGLNPRLGSSSEFKSPKKVFTRDSKLGKQLRVDLVIQVEKTLMNSIRLPQEWAENISLEP